MFGFASDQPSTVIHAEVARRLTALGWRDPRSVGPATWYDTIGGRQVLANNYIYRWSKRLGAAVTSVATLQVGVPETGSTGTLYWDLGSIVPAVDGPKLSCAGEG